MSLFIPPLVRATDANNLAMSGAKWYFYLSGTTTPAPTYQTSGRTAQHTNPVVADGTGAFAPIYLDPSVAYRAVLKTALDVKIPNGDVDPVNGVTDALVLTRTTLADFAASNGSKAYLAESGREGDFVFSTANLSTKVTADTQQGIYVPPSSDTTGASGAWVRKFDGPVQVDWFGPDGSEDGTAINAAIAVSSAIGKPHVRLSAKTYNTAIAITFNVAGLLFEFAGGKINSTVSTNTAAFPWTADGITVRGPGSAYMTSDQPFLNIASTNWVLDGVTIEKPEGSANIPMYIRAGSDNGRMVGCTLKGSNGIGFAESNNISIIGNKFIQRATGGDDAIAIKAITGTSVGWRIIGNYFENCAAFVSIGSEVGVLSATDATYAHYVRDIVVVGNTGKNCANIALIKPGSAYDYRDGAVENVLISDNVLNDPSGSKFSTGIYITPARGAKVRNVKGRNNSVYGRCIGGAVRLMGCVDIYIPDSTATAGTAQTSVSDVDLHATFFDPYNGVANDGSHPGYPITRFASVERALSTYGTFSNITLDITGNGCVQSGIFIDQLLDDVVTVKRAKLTNCTTDTSAVYGGIQFRSRINVGDDITISMASGTSAKAYRSDSGYTADIVAHSDTVFITSSVSAGTDSNRSRRWAAPRNAFAYKVEIVSGTTINKSVDDTNYTQHEIRNESGAGVLQSVTSKLTGGQAFAAGTFNAIYTSAALTAGSSAFNDTFYTRGQSMSYTKNDFGTGNTITDAYIRICWAPY